MQIMGTEFLSKAARDFRGGGGVDGAPNLDLPASSQCAEPPALPGLDRHGADYPH